MLIKENIIEKYSVIPFVLIFKNKFKFLLPSKGSIPGRIPGLSKI